MAIDFSAKSLLLVVSVRNSGRTKMVQTSGEADLATLGRELTSLRRRTRRLRATDWTSWSAAVEETNVLARRIGRVQPRNLEDLVIRYDALRWQLVEVDDAIVDARAKRAFIAFGRALKRMAGR